MTNPMQPTAGDSVAAQVAIPAFATPHPRHGSAVAALCAMTALLLFAPVAAMAQDQPPADTAAEKAATPAPAAGLVCPPAAQPAPVKKAARKRVSRKRVTAAPDPAKAQASTVPAAMPTEIKEVLAAQPTASDAIAATLEQPGIATGAVGSTSQSTSSGGVAAICPACPAHSGAMPAYVPPPPARTIYVPVPVAVPVYQPYPAPAPAWDEAPAHGRSGRYAAPYPAGTWGQGPYYGAPQYLPYRWSGRDYGMPAPAHGNSYAYGDAYAAAPLPPPWYDHGMAGDWYRHQGPAYGQPYWQGYGWPQYRPHRLHYGPRQLPDYALNYGPRYGGYAPWIERAAPPPTRDGYPQQWTAPAYRWQGNPWVGAYGPTHEAWW